MSFQARPTTSFWNFLRDKGSDVPYRTAAMLVGMMILAGINATLPDVWPGPALHLRRRVVAVTLAPTVLMLAWFAAYRLAVRRGWTPSPLNR